MDHHDYRRRLHPLAGSECALPDEEIRRRHDAVAAAMEAAGLEALLLASPADIYYLTGYSTFEVSVHTVLVFAPGQMMLQVPSIETGPAVACTRVEDVNGYRWENIAEVLDPLADALTRAGRRIGVDPWQAALRPGVLDGLKARLPQHDFLDAAGLLAHVRIVKSPLELSFLEHSARITGLGIAAAADAARAGVTDSAVAAAGAQALYGAGSEFMSMQPIVTTGRRSSIIHVNHHRHRIGDGDPVFIELGAAWQRYTAPMMRTVVAGTPTPRMVEVFDTIRRMHDALLGAIRPGASFDAAARAAETALAPLVDDVFFSGVFGYAVGAQFPPSWVEGSGYVARGQERVFAPGMVFHLPLCLRIPGAWGIGCSDTIRVTEDGAVPLTDNPWTLDERQ
ncbi:Putative Xaa-Pro aminopeptidase [Caenispirillum salinarum AK4]|uniref:Putative Xaa-Pro aminopeptidase n=1 Tax=Caenispirillum salinarum AK4 TaxID=1238182 RepID=K9GLM3_9PROT|nr:Xaa-Pro peptidase family protein [Caenispirillum salinarum]EKV25952.1 Putative Xaa-Pro aminopeptidase [Caenispirillum salinarum AK4]